MTQKTDTTPYHGHTGFYIGAFIGALAVFVASAALALHRHVSGWEATLFHDINNWPNTWQGFFRVISVVHDSLWIGAAAVVLAFVFRLYRLSWRLAVCVVAGYAAAFVAKHVIGRPRPAGLLTHVHARTAESGMGFPSGHTMMITILMLTLIPFLPWRWRWIVPIPILLMMLSRVYLGVHLPLDVVGGFAIGLGVVSFVRLLPQPLKVFLRLD